MSRRRLTTRFRLAVFAGALAVLSCGDPSAPPELAPPRASPMGSVHHTDPRPGKRPGWVNGVIHGLLECDPMPTAADTATIGPSGGELRIGPHTLHIPAGALRHPATIIAVAPSDTVNRIQFRPEGLVFEKPAVLTMSYRNCDAEGETNARIVYTDDELVILEVLKSFDRDTRVTARLEHFSNYAVAW